MTSNSKDNKFTTEKKLITELVEILKNQNLSEIELKTDKVSIRLSNNNTISEYKQTNQTKLNNNQIEIQEIDSKSKNVSKNLDINLTGPGLVKSPMVGTVYESAEPGAEPFIKEGLKVKKGQTLFIIEAMKVMNPITSPVDGQVKKIFVKNSQPVEFEEILTFIE